MSSATDATASLIWFTYQKLFAIYCSLHFISTKWDHNLYSEEDDLKSRFVSIEEHDDVAIFEWALDQSNSCILTKNQIHLFQCKHYSSTNSYSKHEKAIIQLYLNQEFHNQERQHTFVDFITLEHIHHYDSKWYLIEEDINEENKKSLISKLNWRNAQIPFPPKFDHIDIPTFTEGTFRKSPIFSNQDHFHFINWKELFNKIDLYVNAISSNFSNWFLKIQKLYFLINRELISGNNILSLHRIKEIVRESVENEVDNILSWVELDWFFKFKKNFLIDGLINTFDIDDYLKFFERKQSETMTEIEKNNLRNHLLVSHQSLIDNIISITNEEELDKLLFWISIERAPQIWSTLKLTDILFLCSKNLPEAHINIWQRVNLFCCNKCLERSYSNIINITWLTNHLLSNHCDKNFVEVYGDRNKIIWCLGHNERPNILEILDRKKDISQVDPYKIKVCCMEEIFNENILHKFWEEDDCPSCKCKFI